MTGNNSPQSESIGSLLERAARDRRALENDLTMLLEKQIERKEQEISKLMGEISDLGKEFGELRESRNRYIWWTALLGVLLVVCLLRDYFQHRGG